MRRYFFISILLFAACRLLALDIVPTSHYYDVYWHWGLINLNAAQVTASYSCESGNFYATLAGKSIDWEGRQYMVNDTIQATVTPTSAEVSYINGVYRKPKVNTCPDLNDAANYRTIHGAGDLSASGATMEAVTVTAYMTGLYYYAQALDFSKMGAGEVFAIPITAPNGSHKVLRITYNGLMPCEVAAIDEPVYDITFEYLLDDGQGSYPVHCQITQSGLPILFGADIRIGAVKMVLAQ